MNADQQNQNDIVEQQHLKRIINNHDKLEEEKVPD